MRCILPALLLSLCLLPACDGKPQGRLEKIARQSTAAGATRASIAQDIIQGIKAKQFSPGDAIDLAYDRVDKAGAQSSGASPDQAASTAATMLAGAVLDAIASVESTLPQGGEFEIFWMKVGRLAFKSGEEAFANARLQESLSLILGGGKRWQNEPYWQRYSDHDGLASAIIAASGDKAGAMQRLQSRNDLSGPALEVYEALKKR